MRNKTRTKRRVDLITVAVLDNRFSAIADEIARTMLRTSRSPIFGEALDFVTAIFDKDLRLVAQRDYVPVLAGAIPPAMKEIARAYEGDINEDDIFIHNDCYAGNNHPPDINIVQPVFYQGKLRFWSVSKGHHADVGGRGICGYDPTSTTIWDDGLVIPAAKLYDKGKLNKGLWDLILRNVKIPTIVEGDLQCQTGATTIGKRSLVDLLEHYGVETVESAIDEILAATEKEMREKISRIPDGVYYGEKAIDHDGIIRDKLVTVRLKIIKEGSELTIDFSQSDAQRPGYANSSLTNTISASYVGIFTTVPGEVKRNAGSMAPIKVIAPKGLVINPEFPLPVTLCTCSMTEAIMEAIWIALTEAVPEWTQAGWNKTHQYPLAGFNPRTKMDFAWLDFFHKGGSGATKGFDGWDDVGHCQTMGGGQTEDPEIAELVNPVHILEYQLLPDMAGAGEWRGGNGCIHRFKLLFDNAKCVTMGAGHRKETVPFGIAGGKSAPVGSIRQNKPDGRILDIDVNQFVDVEKGDILEMRTTGGGGFGDPLRRPLEKVREDVINEYLSVEKAKEDYGVVIDPVTLEVDYKKTAEIRG